MNTIDKNIKFAKKPVLSATMGMFPMWIDATAMYAKDHLIAIAPYKQRIEIWNIKTKQVQYLLDMPDVIAEIPDQAYKDISGYYHTPIIDDLVFSDDGAFVAAIIKDYGVAVWLRDGLLLEIIPCLAVALAFLPNSSVLVCGTKHKELELWEFAPTRCIASLPNIARENQYDFEHLRISKIRTFASEEGNVHLLTVCLFYSKNDDFTYSKTFLYNFKDINKLNNKCPLKIIKTEDYINNVFFINEGKSFLYESLSYEAFEKDTRTGDTIDRFELPKVTRIAGIISTGGHNYIVAVNNAGVFYIFSLIEHKVIMVLNDATIMRAYQEMIKLYWFENDKTFVTVAPVNTKGNFVTMKLWNMSF